MAKRVQFDGGKGFQLRKQLKNSIFFLWVLLPLQLLLASPCEQFAEVRERVQELFPEDRLVQVSTDWWLAALGFRMQHAQRKDSAEVILNVRDDLGILTYLSSKIEEQGLRLEQDRFSLQRVASTSRAEDLRSGLEPHVTADRIQASIESFNSELTPLIEYQGFLHQRLKQAQASGEIRLGDLQRAAEYVVELMELRVMAPDLELVDSYHGVRKRMDSYGSRLDWFRLKAKAWEKGNTGQTADLQSKRFESRPTHIRLPIHWELQLADFNRLRFLPVYYHGLVDQVVRADGQSMGPRMFYRHDAGHTAGLVYADRLGAEMAGIRTAHDELRFILERLDFYDHLSLFIEALPPKQQEAAHAIVFFIYREQQGINFSGSGFAGALESIPNFNNRLKEGDFGSHISKETLRTVLQRLQAEFSG